MLVGDWEESALLLLVMCCYADGQCTVQPQLLASPLFTPDYQYTCTVKEKQWIAENFT